MGLKSQLMILLGDPHGYVLHCSILCSVGGWFRGGRDHGKSADFLFIQVQVAKQLHCLVLTEGRVFFGDKVFTSDVLPSQLYRRKFIIHWIDRLGSNHSLFPKQCYVVGSALGNGKSCSIHGARRLSGEW
jgi:hypothetical protein